MTSRLLIKSGTLVSATEVIRADILIDHGKIEAIGTDMPAGDSEMLDATGKLILPGGIDPHTHFDLPMFDTVSSDDHYTGHKAAAFGGTTTVIDFIPQDFPSLREAVDTWHAKADSKAAVDFAFHMNITSLTEDTEAQIPQLLEEGITSLKVFTAYNGRLRLEDGEIFRVMRIGAGNGMLTLLHAENGDVIEILTREAIAAGHTTPEWHAHTRPAWGAVESVLRGIALAQQAGSPLYVVHVNTAGGMEQIGYARAKGLPIMGETCPQYLFFNLTHLQQADGAKWICSPPMRSESDNEALWESLSNGTLQTIGTDHCPFFYDGTQAIEYEGEQITIPGKELGRDDFTKIPNGLPGVGDRLPILWSEGVGTGRISMNQFVALTSTNAAKAFGLYPKKGTLLPGSDADIVVWDPAKEIEYGVAYAQHRTDYNLYEGWKLKGFPEKVFLRGHLIVDGGEWKGKPGMGEYLSRRPNAEII